MSKEVKERLHEFYQTEVVGTMPSGQRQEHPRPRYELFPINHNLTHLSIKMEIRVNSPVKHEVYTNKAQVHNQQGSIIINVKHFMIRINT